MNRTIILTLLAAVAAAIVFAVLRAMTGTGTVAAEAPAPTAAEPLTDAGPPTDALLEEDEAEFDDPEEDREVVAITSDGWAFVPDQHDVELIRLDEVSPSGELTPEVREQIRGGRRLGVTLDAGDYIGARVKRGSPEEPWRLEALGRDGEYVSFVFETEDAARAALDLIMRKGIVKLGQDEDGRLAPPSNEQFEEARRLHDQTEAELAMESEFSPDEKSD